MKERLCIAVAVLAILVPNAAAAAGNETARKVLIGYAAPLKQEPAQGARDAARLAIKELNAGAMTIDGAKVVFELLEQDDKADPNIAVLSARFFVSSRVAAVIGHWNTGASLSAAPVYSEAGIAQISPSSTGSRYTQLGFQTTFRLVGNDGARSAYIGNYALATLKATRIAIVDDGTAFGSMIADQVSAYVRSNNGVVTGRSSISNKMSDYTPALEAIRQSRPDLLFHAGLLYGGHLDHGGDFIGDIRKLGFPKKVILGESTVDPDVLKQMGGDIAVYSISPGLPLEKLPRGKIFEKAYRAQYATRITPYTPPAYDAVYLIAAAAKQANSTDPRAITAALHKIKYSGLIGPIAFSESGDLLEPSFTVYQIKDGAWSAVSTLGR